MHRFQPDMARFTSRNVLLVWLTLVTPCLLSRLDALPITDNDDTITTTLETMTTDVTNSSNCADFEFQCRNGECVGKGLVCDSEKHCPDGSDEDREMCRERVCYHNAPFKCEISGQCLPYSYVCDDEIDCLHGEDEAIKLCQPSTPPTIVGIDETKIGPDQMGQTLYRNEELQNPQPKRTPWRRSPVPPPPNPHHQETTFDPFTVPGQDPPTYH